MAKRVVLVLLLCLIGVSMVFAGGQKEEGAENAGKAMAEYDATKVQWDPNHERIVRKDYQLPEGALDAIKAEGSEEIVVYNWGDLSWDPATLLNGSMFTRMTDVSVEFVGTPDEQMTPKLQPLFMAKSDAVDIVPLDETNYANYVSRGWLMQVDFLWDEETMSEYHSGLHSTVLDGHYYSVPQVGRIIDVLYYRPSMLKAAGFDGPPETWEELVEMAQALTIDKNNDGQIDQWGFVFKGGGVLDGKVKFNTPETIRVVQLLSDLRNKYKVVPPGVTAYQHGDIADFFLSGNVAMVIDPTYLYARCLESDLADDFDVAVQPIAYKGGPATQIQHWNGWGLSNYSKNKTAGLIYMDIYRSYRGQVNEFAIENNEVFLKKAYEDPQSKLVGYNDVLAKIDDTVVDIYEGQGEVYKAVIAEFQKALLEQKTAEEAMNDAQARIDKILGY